MKSDAAPLLPFRQELPYRELWPIARVLAAREPGVALLDSSCAPEHEGRWSVVGWRPRRTLRWPTGRPGALEAIRRIVDTRRLLPGPDGHGPFHGGFLGWISYDIGRHVERLPARHPPLPGTPDFVLAEYEALLVEDRRDRRLFLAGACDAQEGPSRLLARQSEILEVVTDDGAEDPAGPAAGPLVDDVDRATFEARVRRVLDYIAAGDIFQANLSHRLAAPALLAPREMYARLRAASPAPYGCYMDLGGPVVLSISPELFLRREGGQVVTRPIKGTRPRSADPVRDAALRTELEGCGKEKAELAMIVDLLRNDLGRVAETGSVVVEEARGLHAHPTVHHATATVTARVAPEVNAADLLAATMPGGSVTGAPKIRAMEILEEVEDCRRGPYCGAAGWFGYDGDVALNILIRTLVVRDGEVSFHVGGGIVADSDPAHEYDETMAKAAAMRRALGGAVDGSTG